MRHYKEILNITLSGLIAGLLYWLLTDDLTKPAPFFNGIIIGLIGGFLAGIFEVIVFRPRGSRPAFMITVLLKVVTYFILVGLLIAFVKARIDSFFLGLTFTDYIRSETYQEFLRHGEFKRILTYSIFIIFVIIFTMQTSRYLGKGVLFNLLTGKYHSPKEEKQIFLLIDICSSTSIAEKINQVDYFKLLDQFFFDVSESVRPYHGFIYRYIGDQVTIVWKMQTPHKNADCLRAFFAAKQRIHHYRELYFKKYGFVPDFRGTAHLGDVVAVEIGDVKTQVVYQGITLYEVNKLEKSPGRINNGLCISDDLLKVIEVPKICRVTPVGNTAIKGDRLIGVHEVEEN